MTVKELIKILESFDPELTVCYRCYSEQCLLEKEDINIEELCEDRGDGWIANKRPDKPSFPYLVFPGN